jgi:hypothetical protein
VPATRYRHASSRPVVVIVCGRAKQYTIGWISSRSALWKNRNPAINKDAAADRGNKRNGRAAVEHRRNELGVATGAHANA